MYRITLIFNCLLSGSYSVEELLETLSASAFKHDSLMAALDAIALQHRH